MHKVKILIIFALCGLLGFTSVDQVIFSVAYDRESLDSLKVFEEIESYSESFGFIAGEKIEELYPEKTISSHLTYGTPYDGGISLTLKHFENGNIEINGVRLVGGCTSSREIEEMNVFHKKLENHLKVQLNSEIEIKKETKI